MKLLHVKTQMKRIIKDNRLIIKNPDWWREDCISVYDLSKEGIYSETFGWDNDNNFLNPVFSFIFCPINEGKPSKSRICRFYITHDIELDDELLATKMIYSDDNLEIKLNQTYSNNCGYMRKDPFSPFFNIRIKNKDRIDSSYVMNLIRDHIHKELNKIFNSDFCILALANWKPGKIHTEYKILFDILASLKDYGLLGCKIFYKHDKNSNGDYLTVAVEDEVMAKGMSADFDKVMIKLHNRVGKNKAQEILDLWANNKGD